MTGTVVISLDFELGWGHRTARPEYIDRLRSASTDSFERIRSLIDLFDEYEVPATWAVVGKLIQPGEDSLFHNPDLFRYLLDADTAHDIGLHSYAHRTFDELSMSEARDDLRDGVDALDDWGIDPRTFIYPRGIVDHTNVLSEYGIEYYRSRQMSGGLIGLITRSLIPRTTRLPTIEGCSPPYPIPETLFVASRRPELLRWWQIAGGLRRAISGDELVHFWLHPHNVVTDEETLSLVERMVQRLAAYRDRGALRCVTMAGLFH